MKILKIGIQKINEKTCNVSFNDHNVIWSYSNNTGKTLMTRLIIIGLGADMHLPRSKGNTEFLKEIKNIGLNIVHNNKNYTLKRKVKNGVLDEYLTINGVAYNVKSSSSGTHVSDFYKKIIGWYPYNLGKPLSINFMLNFLYKDQDFGITEFSPLLFPSMYSITVIDKYMLFKLCLNQKIDDTHFEVVDKNALKNEVVNILDDIINKNDIESNSKDIFTEYEKKLIKEQMKRIKELQIEVNSIDKELYKKDGRRAKNLTSSISMLRALNVINDEEVERFSVKLNERVSSITDTLIDTEQIKDIRTNLITEIKKSRDAIKVILNGRSPISFEQPFAIIESIAKVKNQYVSEIEEHSKREEKQNLIKNSVFSFLRANREKSLKTVEDWRGGNASNSGSDLFLREIAKYLHIVKDFPGDFPIIVDGAFMNEVDEKVKEKVVSHLNATGKQIILTTIKSANNDKILKNYTKFTLDGTLLESLEQE